MGTGRPDFRSASELPALVSYVRERRCVLFVGAGLSRPAGYPGWGDLMRHVVEGTHAQLGDAARKDELESLLAQYKFAEVADQCRTLLGRTFFGRMLRDQLARPASPPEATHRAIVQTPYACIVTTNFDTLLEDAFARWSDFGIPKAPTGMELAQHGTLLLDGAFFILKAHGTIHDDDSMVFTSEDYRRITHANPAFQAVMSSLLLTHAVLFVGYSLSDPNFRLLLDSQLTTFGSEAPPRYALMENVSASERAILRRTAGIEVISFAKGAFGEVAGLLRYLAKASAPEQSPAQAAAPVQPPVQASVQSPRRVLRTRTADPAMVVRLRARDVMVDCTWFQTTLRDLDGVNLPLERITTATNLSPAWAELSQYLSNATDIPIGDVAQGARWHVGDLLARVLEGVDEALLATPPSTTIILDIPPELWALPWEWTTVGEWSLALARPTCRRMPGIPDASRGRPFVRSPLRVLLIGDPLADSSQTFPLPGARAEVEGLALQLSNAAPETVVTTLIGREASYATVLRELRHGRYDVVHFSGVSHDDGDGSYLMLHDGKVGTSELVTLLIKRPPALLFLNTIYSGFVPVFSQAFPLALREGTSFDDHYRELRRRRVGFERAAARSGVGTFVGVMGLTDDEVAGQVARAFYDILLSGKGAAHALHAARNRVRATLGKASWGRADTTSLQIAMAGYPDLRLVPARGVRATARRA